MPSENIQIVATAQDRASPTLAKLSANMKKLGAPGQTGGMGALSSGLSAIGVGALGATAAIGALTAIGGQISQFLGDSISKASDLNETISASNAVFQGNADEMLKWGEDSAHAFGMAKGEALDAARTFGGLFKSVGFTLDDATQQSQQMTELGADLASFFNTDMQTALESLRSGLSGESEPLRKFNVFLSETAVSAKLVALGQKKLNGAWTESQKVQGRLAIIMEQTKDAHGDFAKTQDGLANATREFDAALTNLQTDIGEDFLGFMKEGAGGANDFMVALQGVVDLIEGGLGIEQLDMTNPLIDQLADFLPPELAAMLHKTSQDARVKAASEEIAQQVFDAQHYPSKLVQDAISGAIHGANAKELGDDVGQLLGIAFTTAADRMGSVLKPTADNIMDGLVDGIRSNKDDVRDAMDDITWAINHPLKLAAEVNRITGALNSRKVAEGLASNNPLIRKATEQGAQILMDKYLQLTGQAFTWGTKIGNAVVNGIEFGFGGGPKLGGIGSILGGSRKKGLAAGGFIPPGESRLTGERGPEVITAGRRGLTVSPNHASGSGPIHVVSVNELRRLLDEGQGRQLALAPSSSYSR